MLGCRKFSRFDLVVFCAMWFYPDKGESEGYTVKCKERDFSISNYPLEQTEFMYAQKQGMVRLQIKKTTMSHDLYMNLEVPGPGTNLKRTG